MMTPAGYPQWAGDALGVLLIGILLGVALLFVRGMSLVGTSVAFACLGSVFSVLVAAAVRTGHANTKSLDSVPGSGDHEPIRRSQEPILFWISVGLYGVLAAGCYVGAVAILRV